MSKDTLMDGFSFDYSWVKRFELRFEGESFQVELSLWSPDKEPPTDEQKAALSLFVEKQASFEERAGQLLSAYVQQEGIANPKAAPTTLLFQQDGSFGLLFDCSWDEEHGVVVVLHPEEQVGVQDIFL